MMKKLKESFDLYGEQEKITATEFRKSPGEVFLQVQLGMTFQVTKNGDVIAIISPPVHEPTALELGAEVRRLKLKG